MFASQTRTRCRATVAGILAAAVIFLVVITSVNCAREVSSPANLPNPTIIIEAILTRYGIGGYRDSMLLARLRDDGKVEWDRYSATSGGHEYLLEASKLHPARVASIKRELGVTDLRDIQTKMGPYTRFIDTSYEISVRMAITPTEPLVFSVVNPWCNKSITCLQSKPLPRNVQSILCQVEVLRAEVAHEPIEDFCEAERKEHE
jgi:hypothetical protein